jgi:Cu(I)/Ag(I) efflux system membrane fusion protein
MLDMQTRSVKIRVEASNPDYTLKPGMFVTAEVQAEIDAKGRVVKPEWAGKYLCPLHPRDEASAEPGTCPDSGMPLRPASSFGYADDKDTKPPLLVPSSAPLITGKRSIVYVEVPNTERPTYELREVVLGPRAGDKYVVYDGLKEGELVVSRGNFKIDSAMQIVARPSMMSPPEPKPTKQTAQKAEDELIEKVQAPPEFLKALTPVISEYLRLKEALVTEQVDEAAQAAEKLSALVDKVSAQALDPKAKEVWTKLAETMTTNLKTIAENMEIEVQRKAFDPLSECFARVVMAFRHVMEGPLFLYHCPMAFDKQGAYWLEAKQDPRNPYFGEKPFKGQDMLKCSELVEKIPPETSIAEERSDNTHGADSAPDKKKQGSGSKPGGTEHGSHSDQEGGEK